MQVIYLFYYIFISKFAKNIDQVQVTTPNTTALIQEFTKPENILVIYKNNDISKIYVI